LVNVILPHIDPHPAIAPCGQRGFLVFAAFWTARAFRIGRGLGVGTTIGLHHCERFH
jgi:hypothetical protein